MTHRCSVETLLKTKIANVEKELDDAKRRIEKLKITKFHLLRNTPILCPTCEVKTAIKRWIFIQENHYIPPTGDTEGAYWVASSVDVCSAICPKCLRETYIYRHPQKLEIVMLKEKVSNFHGLFALVKERCTR